jgi:hypothetical protein
MRVRNEVAVVALGLLLAACGGGGSKERSLTQRICDRGAQCFDSDADECRAAVDELLAPLGASERAEAEVMGEECLAAATCDAFDSCLTDVETALTGGLVPGPGTGNGTGDGTGTGTGTGAGTGTPAQLPLICGQWAGVPCIEYAGVATQAEIDAITSTCTSTPVPGTCLGSVGDVWVGYCDFVATSTLSAKVYLPTSTRVADARIECAAEGGTWVDL